MSVILDFYGLPGCGKSTVSHLLAERLRAEGRSVAEPSYDLVVKHRPAVRRMLKMWECAAFSVAHSDIASKVCRLVKDCGYKGSSVVLQFVNVTNKLQEELAGKADYIIFDEGMVQAAMSLTVEKNPERAYRVYLELRNLQQVEGKKVVPVYLSVSMSKSLERMEMRNTSDSRVEKLATFDEKRKWLQLCQQALDSFHELSQIEQNVDCDNIEDIVDALYEKIIKKYKNINTDERNERRPSEKDGRFLSCKWGGGVNSCILTSYGTRLKKYVTGYTAGVYDMFHIGHLNVIRNAKALCEKLVVAVSTDELVQEYKHKTPIIPFCNRAAIVEAIRYVDRVVAQTDMDKVTAALKNEADVMFVGDDWKGTEKWNKIEADLKSVGIDVVYLPHTDGISSSYLREIISK